MEEQFYLSDLDIIKEQLINESKFYKYPMTKDAIRFRYRNTAYDLYRRYKEQLKHKNFLSFGTRRSSSVSNYGNTPILIRRSISSNGDLSTHVVQSGGSLRGVPTEMEQEAKYRNQFGSLRGLPSEKRLSDLYEGEEAEVTGGNAEKTIGTEVDVESNDSWLIVTVKDKLNKQKKGENLKNKDVKKSSESLISSKKKKGWWFRRKKLPNEDLIGMSTENLEHSSIPDKALSDNNLSHTVYEAEHSDDLHKSQIILKGYSQKNIAGVNLSGRSPSANNTITSRNNLVGSGVLVMEGDPKSEEDNRDQSYEEQFEKNVCSEDKSVVSVQNGNVVTQFDTGSNTELVKISEYEPQISDKAPLSPDSRPIRPLHCSSPVANPSLEQTFEHHHVSGSSSSKEFYPSSLMDKPIISRLAKKRSTSENNPHLSDIEPSSPIKKSNIAYTLTFHGEPICVNLRTNSQSAFADPQENENGANKKVSESSTPPTFERQLSLPNGREPSTFNKFLHNSSKKNSTSEQVIESVEHSIEETLVHETISSETSSPKQENIKSVKNFDMELKDPEQKIGIDSNNKSGEDLQYGNDESNESHLEYDTNDKCDASKPASKIVRRNTFTLPTKPDIKRETVEQSVTGSDHSSNQNEEKEVTHEESISTRTSTNDSSAPAVGSRIPIKRGRAGGDSMSRIPTIASPSSANPLQKHSTSSPTSYRSTKINSLKSTQTASPTTVKSSAIPSIPDQINTSKTSSKSAVKSPERSSLRAKRSGIPSTRKPSLDEKIVSKFSSKIPTHDNFIRTDNDAIVVRRETIIELKPEARSSLCSVM